MFARCSRFGAVCSTDTVLIVADAHARAASMLMDYSGRKSFAPHIFCIAVDPFSHYYIIEEMKTKEVEFGRVVASYGPTSSHPSRRLLTLTFRKINYFLLIKPI